MAKKITVVERYPEIEYALVNRHTEFQTWVAAHWLYEDNPDNICWGQGHYFQTLIEAVDFIKSELEKHIEVEEDFYEEDPFDGMMPCDFCGTCSGTSCSNYWRCHS